MTIPELHILSNSEDVAHAGAELVARLAEERTQAHGHFAIALSGGSTPRRLYELLASPPYAGSIAWDRWYVFWSDERCAPPDHQDSNYRMAKEALLARVPIPAGQIHRIRGEAKPQDAAQEYEQEVRRVLQASTPAFDLVLLGIGDDGHTAPLFPNTSALEEKRRLVVANWVPHLQAHRITFTLPLINAASAIAFLVTDESKTVVLANVLQPPPTALTTLPAALVRPVSGSVHWLLTRAVASGLREVSV